MIDSRRAWRIPAAVVLAALAVGIADVRTVAQDQAASLSAAFRRAASRARGALVSVRVPDGMRVPTPYVPTRPGRFGPMPALPPTVDRMPGGDDRTGCTGVVIDGDKGHILTVDQPTQGASQLLVTFPDGQERLTSQVRRDLRSGLALLVVDTQGLNPTRVNWGDPAKLEPGDWLVALGQPGVGDPSMAVGVFSTRRRGEGEELLETDAAITRIGAGGVLVNLSGDVVGISKLAGRRADGFEGMGHAIPAGRARRIAADLAQFGQVQRAYLGIQVDPVGPVVAGRPVAPSGVRVASVLAGTPAAEAGVRPGDVIIAVGGQPIEGVWAVQGAVEMATIGEELPLTIERQGKRIEIKVRPRAIPAPMGTSRSPRTEPAVDTRRDALRRQVPYPGPLPTLVPPGTLPGPPDD